MFSTKPVVYFLIAALCLSSCNRQPISSPSVAQYDSAEQETQAVSGGRAASELPLPAVGQRHDETWMAAFMNAAKVGHTHLLIQDVEEDGKAYTQFRYDDRLQMKRYRDMMTITTNLICLETHDGQLVRFTSGIQSGPGSSVTDGHVQGKRLQLKTKTEGKAESFEIDWQPDYGGFFTDQRSLAKKPMEPGETRQLKSLLPVIYQLATIEMKAVEYEAVEIDAKVQQLLRIDVTTTAKATQLRAVLWTDASGKIWRSKDLQLGLETHITTRDKALRTDPESALDLGESTLVRVKRPLEAAHQTGRVVYRVRLPEGSIQSLLADGLSQRVTRIDDSNAEIVVQSIRPNQPATLNAGDITRRPAAGDLAASALIQSDDPRVVAMANAVAPGVRDHWQLVCALERLVQQSIRLKNYSTAMATPAEVIQSLEGDCTEHAMLLVALCRARKIPARAAIGLVYYPAGRGFAYHMWTEAWIKDRWIPLDATLGKGGIGAAHIKFADSTMQAANAYAEMLPVVQAIGRVEIEIVEVESR